MTLADAIEEYAALMEGYGIDSRETVEWFDRHCTIPEFEELAAECRRLETVALTKGEFP